MPSKSEVLQAILNNVIEGSSDIKGVVVVDNDGLVLGSALGENQNSQTIAAITADLIIYAGRSSRKLGQGAVNQTFIQAEKGNLIALRAGLHAAFVALTPSGANLGLTFVKCREAANQIATIL